MLLPVAGGQLSLGRRVVVARAEERLGDVHPRSTVGVLEPLLPAVVEVLLRPPRANPVPGHPATHVFGWLAEDLLAFAVRHRPHVAGLGQLLPLAPLEHGVILGQRALGVPVVDVLGSLVELLRRVAQPRPPGQSPHDVREFGKPRLLVGITLLRHGCLRCCQRCGC